MSTNPIHITDYTYLTRRMTPRRTRWITFGAIGLSISLVIFSLGLTLFAPNQFYDVTDSTALTALGYGALGLGVFALVMHFRTVIGAVTLASSSIINRRTISWEQVILTGMDARRMVWGKWWAVVRLTWRDFMWLGVLRGGVVVGLGAFAFTRADNIFYANDPVSDLAPLQILLSFGLVLAITLINCLFTAAAGVVGSLNTSVSGAGIRGVPMIITVLPFVTPMIVHLTQHAYIDPIPANVPLMVMVYAMPTLLDNGAFVGAAVANVRDVGYMPLYVGVLIFVLVVVTWWTFVLLFAGEVMVRVQGGNAAA